MQSTTPLQTLKYSAFLGGIFASDAATEAKINEAITAVGGETVRKKGFTGTAADGPTAKALATLKAAGITPITMKGPLCSVRVVQRMVNGMQANYLNVTLGTLAGKQFLSIEMTSKAAQDLVRRLMDATPGVETEIRLYANYGQRKGASRAYADHFASAKQDGKDLRGVNPADMWGPIRAKQDALKAAGIDDKAMFTSVQNKVTLEWHLDLTKQIAAKFATFYEQRPAPAAASPVAAAPAPAAASQPECTVYANNACGTPNQCKADGRCLAATDYYPLPGQPATASAAPPAAAPVDGDPFGLNDPEPVATSPVVNPFEETAPPALVVVPPPVRQPAADPFTL